jgi:hypothetical protein
MTAQFDSKLQAVEIIAIIIGQALRSAAFRGSSG